MQSRNLIIASRLIYDLQQGHKKSRWQKTIGPKHRHQVNYPYHQTKTAHQKAGCLT
jgi:hypothetical protein